MLYSSNEYRIIVDKKEKKLDPIEHNFYTLYYNL